MLYGKHETFLFNIKYYAYEITITIYLLPSIDYKYDDDVLDRFTSHTD